MIKTTNDIKTLSADISHKELQDIRANLCPLLKEYGFTDVASWTVAFAFALGKRQGKHDEAQRKKIEVVQMVIFSR